MPRGALRVLALVIGLGTLAAILVSDVCGLAVALLFWKWLTLKGIEGRRRLIAFCCLMLYPYSFMLYGTVYSDPPPIPKLPSDPVIWGYDEDLYSRTLYYDRRPVEASLLAFRAARESTAAILELLPEEAWSRAGWRPRSPVQGCSSLS